MMTPAAARAAILVTELLTFFIGTAFLAYFVSYASALEPASGEPPAPDFPVVVYEGDRSQPAPAGYRVMPWSEWETLARNAPGASLLPPQPAATLALAGGGEASFTVSGEGGPRTTVTLRWRTGNGEQEARYVAQARAIEPLYLRSLSGETILTSAIAAFLISLFLGRALRRRWLTRGSFF